MNYREEALQRTEKEIVAEKAATLGRAGERLEAALRLAAELHDAMRDAPEGDARALEARRILIIQREAIGLRNHRLVDQQFPEPPRLDA